MWKRRVFMGVLASSFIVTSACANYGGGADQNHQNRPEPNIQQSEPAPQESSLDAAVIQIMTHDGNAYVSLDEIVNVLEFNSEWDSSTQSYSIGDTDVIYEVKMNSRQAEMAEEDVQLPSEPILINGRSSIPLEAIDKLFQEGLIYEVIDQQLIVYPHYNDAAEELANDLDFRDDPADPAGDEEASEEDALNIGETSPEDAEVWNPNTDDESLTVFTRKSVDANKLIATGKKYLGVKYKFGAGKYAQTKRFDCSSFVQQLYNTYGVRLPRTARRQAEYGVSVSRSNLRKGDLLYFYVPGRFRTNKTVGHVGVYIGNNNMLHSSPSPEDGVQITNINRSYWKETYLGAKRVIR